MIKLPKTVKIHGKTYNVDKRPNEGDSSGAIYEQEITVGTKNQNDERVFENFLHEVIELVICEQSLRFTASDDELVFVMSHKEFTNVVGDISSVIYPMLKDEVNG